MKDTIDSEKHVIEGSTVGSLISVVTARDVDGDTITYSLKYIRRGNNITCK